MVRRRREAPSTTEPQAEAQTSQPEGPEPQATLTVRGTANSVKRQLGIQTDEAAEKPAVVAPDDEKQKFVDALRNPKYLICVKRMTPREFQGQKTNVEVWRAELPLGYQEIQEEIAKGFGGEKYRVAVLDPASNNTVAADTFVVDGDPIIPETDMSQTEMERVLMQGQPKSASDISEEGLERRARLTAKMVEVEALEGQLEDARKRRETGNKVPAAVPQDNSRVEELDRRLTEAKHQAELEARDRRHAEEMKELKALIAQNSQPKKDDGMMMLLEQMREDRKAAQSQFTAILTQMKDDKLNAVLDEVKSLRNKPSGQSGSLLEQAEAMLKLRKLFGWGGGDADEDDEDDDENDDRPWYERALDKLGGKFGDKLLEKFTAMEDKGETVDREAFLKGMMDHADQVAAEAVKKQQQKLPLPPAANTLPPPPPPSRPASTAGPAPVTVLPPPPPSAAPVAPPPAPAPQMPQALTIEQEIVIRVGGVLEMLERELELRPNEYLWNYEGAYNALPEAVLEKICAAPDPLAMIDAFAIQHISVEKLAEIKAKIAGNPRILAWVKVGHDELKQWFAEKMKNPTFDPFADDDGEEEAE